MDLWDIRRVRYYELWYNCLHSTTSQNYPCRGLIRFSTALVIYILSIQALQVSLLLQLVLLGTEWQGGPLDGHPVSHHALPEVPETLLDVTVIVQPEHLEPQSAAPTDQRQTMTWSRASAKSQAACHLSIRLSCPQSLSQSTGVFSAYVDPSRAVPPTPPDSGVVQSTSPASWTALTMSPASSSLPPTGGLGGLF